MSLPLRSALRELEAESIHVFREVAAELARPVLLYSIGKDSAVLLHLARKAFWPGPLPFPVLHIDTGWKFREMIAHRDALAARGEVEVLVWHDREGAARVDPFRTSPEVYTRVMKTEPLKRALEHHGFDAAFGGARRDEERSRAKERVFSFRDRFHAWEPRRQRPELWNLYNGRVRPGESIRVFPLSNWTERDVWSYVGAEEIPLVSLYFAAERPTVERDGTLIVVDDERFPLRPGERPVPRRVRFRTLGCYPLTGAVESSATTIAEILAEMDRSGVSERGGRLIDGAGSASMEAKKREGYF